MSVPTYPNYINGEWRAGATFENRNPANTQEVVGLFVRGTPEDVEAAAHAAQAALPGWSSLPAPARGAYLFRVAESLERKAEQLAVEMTREEGKTLAEARGEVRRSINIFRYFAGEGARLPGLLVPSERERVHTFAIRRPVGVVGLITPWNFPSAIPAWKLAPALICGNTVVLKPSSDSPLTGWRFMEVMREAGLPVTRVSGGNSSLLWLLARGEPLPAEITELRCGEALLLGQDALFYEPLPGCRQDACVLRAEVLEEYTKPARPGGCDSVAQGQDNGLRRRLVLGIGRQDLGTGAVKFLHPEVHEIGRSADYLVVEVSRPGSESLRPGSRLEMIPGYEALVAAWSSPYVEVTLR
ncbi:MAG: aldehyde dehydrogenase family protein [Bryobacteraceae bacterium]|nr:aldehyde dehydrogenase family protein [Bryobacteraceae bacterium]